MENQKPAEQSKKAQPDYVVIDRKILHQTLDAVLNTLRSSINFELLQKNQVIDPEQQADLHQQMVNARGSLITGIKQLLETVDTLPSVKVTTRES